MSIKREYDFDQVGHKDMYLFHHEDHRKSLAKNIRGVQRIRFFATPRSVPIRPMKCLRTSAAVHHPDRV